jgi:stalled ribosome rescue protein Dom34
MPGRNTSHGFERPGRGYAVAALVGLDKYRAVLWIVYSKSVKQQCVVDWPKDRGDGGGNDRYNFFNAIIAALKPVFSSGVSSLVVASTGIGSSLADSFVAHVRKHHAYLVRVIRMESIRAEADTVNAVKVLVKTQAFQAVAEDVIEQESDSIIQLLDARLSDDTGRFTILFSLEEIDRFFRTYSRAGPTSVGTPEYIFMTDRFWTARKSDSRLQRVTDLARNAGVKVRVLQEENAAGEHIAQLGGLVCLVARMNPADFPV